MIIAIKYVFNACPTRVIILIFLLSMQGILPGVNVYMTGKIIQSIQLANTSNNEFVINIAFWCLSLLGVQSIQPLVNLVQGDVNEITTRYFNEKIMERINNVYTLYLFEDKKKHEQLDLLRREASYRPLNFIITIVYLLRALIMVAVLLFLLIKYSGIGPVICAFSVLPLLYINVRVEERNWKSLLHNTKESVIMRYVYDVCMNRNHLQEIRIFNLGGYLFNKYSVAAHNMHKNMHKQRLYALFMPMPMIAISLTLLFIGVYLFLDTLTKKALAVSTVVMAFQSIVMLKSYLDDMAQNGAHIFTLTSFFKTYHEFMSGFVEDFQNGSEIINSDKPFSIAINNLSFKYNDNENNTLKNISLTIPSGQKVAILGRNGSGKTTLIKLLMRMYNISQGDVYISGYPIENLNVTEYRKKISAVLQEYGKYEFTVEENIVFDEIIKNNNKEKITSLLDEVQIELPYDYQLGKKFGGHEISVGQWQKLAIARSLYKKANLFIFDEFSSSLDPEVEYKLFSKILSLNSTIIAVTHRLGKIKEFDRIIVMDEGNIIEDGDYYSLLQKKGKFFDMWHAQFKSVIEE